MKLLQGSFFLKLSALVVAILTYLYVHNEIYTEEKTSKQPDPSYRLLQITSKNLPVRVRVETEPPDGYRILSERMYADPPNVRVIGPKAMLDEATSAETALIDVSGETGAVVKDVPIQKLAGVVLTGEPYMVEVTIPIEKIPQ